MDDRQPWQMPPHEFVRLLESSRVPRGSLLALKHNATNDEVG
jgi:hypothetical protein